MIKNIKYIGFYSPNNLKYNRTSALSAMDKMNYVSHTLNSLNYHVKILSPSWILGTGFDFHKKITLNEKTEVEIAPSFGSSNKFTNYLSIITSLSWLFIKLILTTKKNDKIFAYHSPWLSLVLLIAKKIRRFYLILEVEEIYQDVQTIHPFLDTLEKVIIENSDAFIFSTELLESKWNTKQKPFIILYGNYKVPKVLNKPQKDGKVKLLYAGIIDRHKAGAFNAVELANFLDKNYEIYIIGFGEVDQLKERINQINQFSECKVFYEGVKTGDDYTKFCQSCHIGLSTQNNTGNYVDSSFPSKVLSYMGLGLNVVSVDILPLRLSKISKKIYYISDYKKIRDLIQHINLNNFDHQRNIILNLDIEFKTKLSKILNNE